MDCWSFDGAVLIKNKRGKIKPINSLKCLINADKDYTCTV